MPGAIRSWPLISPMSPFETTWEPDSVGQAPEWHNLVPHPDTPCPAVRGLSLHLDGNARTGLCLTYVLTADPDGVRWPIPAPAARCDELWRHTCLEAFVGVQGEAGYREFNFSPSGAWAAYRFDAYRQGMAELPMPAPEIVWQTQGEGSRITVRLPPGALPAGKLLLGACAVIEAVDGGLSFWALRHAAGRPDFHQPYIRQLELP